MFSEFGPNIWLSDGPTVEVIGFRYPTRVAVIALSNGDLFVWSPISLTQALREAVDQLGRVAHIVAPNSLHHLALADWIAAYPDATIHAAPRLAKKRSDLTFDFDLGRDPHSDWSGQIDQVIVDGNLITDEVVFFHRESKTVLFVDLLQQFPQDWHKGWRGKIAKADLMAEGEPSVPRKFRLAFIRRKAARASVSSILDWPAQKVVMAHGTPVLSGGQAYLKRAFRWLID